MSTPILQVSGASKRFGGVQALSDVGITIEKGQVVGLIEAMKVFNEITAPVSGTVTAVKAENGQLVQPGDPLIYIG